jgi:hypothetical protein
MLIEIIRIDDLVTKNADELVGKQFEISCILFVSGNNRAWIACNKLAGIEKQFNIPIEHNRLFDLLLERVPVFVGGKYLYCDDAVIIGTFKTIKQKLILARVIDLCVKRDGKEFNFAKGLLVR